MVSVWLVFPLAYSLPWLIETAQYPLPIEKLQISRRPFSEGSADQFVSSEMPSRFGPRQFGQSPPDDRTSNATNPKHRRTPDHARLAPAGWPTECGKPILFSVIGFDSGCTL